MKNIIKTNILLMLFFILFFLFFSIGCNNKKKEINKPVNVSAKVSDDKKKESANIEVRLPVLTSLSKDFKEWDLQSEKIIYDDKKNTAYAKGIKCIFYNKEKKEYITLTSEGAYVDLNSNSLKFKGEVKITSKQGVNMIITRAVWDGKKKKIFGYDNVRVNDGVSDIFSDKIEIDPALNTIKFYGNVKAKFNEKDDLIIKTKKYE